MLVDKRTNSWLFKPIMIVTVVFMISISIFDVHGSAECPEKTNWNGNECVFNDTGEPIIFTDYQGNPVVKSKLKSNSQNVSTEQPIIITAPIHEILRDLMIKKPQIQELKDYKGIALEQKKLNDSIIPTNLTRNNFYFNLLVERSATNAEEAFNYSVYGKQIQNLNFGDNHQRQVIYDVYHNRNNDPELKNGIIQERERAQLMLLAMWGDFTNHE